LPQACQIVQCSTRYAAILLDFASQILVRDFFNDLRCKRPLRRHFNTRTFSGPTGTGPFLDDLDRLKGARSRRPMASPNRTSFGWIQSLGGERFEGVDLPTPIIQRLVMCCPTAGVISAALGASPSAKRRAPVMFRHDRPRPSALIATVRAGFATRRDRRRCRAPRRPISACSASRCEGSRRGSRGSTAPDSPECSAASRR
jgi:hypothetical protein